MTKVTGPGMRLRESAGRIKCVRCAKPTAGQAQLCPACKRDKTLCRTCGKPHGGPPATTLYCPTCRRDRRRKPRGPFNPKWTEADDALIRQVYSTTNARHLGEELRKAFPTRPKWSMRRRAQLIGCATMRKKEPRWTPEEDAILKECAWMVPERVAIRLRERGFKRTLTAVALRMRRSELHATIDGYTAQALSRIFDVDTHKVLRWIRKGQLAAQRSGTTGDHHDRWYVTTEAVRDFCFAHPEEIELTKIERAGSKAWFLDLLTYGRISADGADAKPLPVAPGGAPLPLAVQAQKPMATAPMDAGRTVLLYGEQITITALAQISGKTVAELFHRIDVIGLTPKEAAFGPAIPDAPAPPAGVVDALAQSIATQLAALMKRHKAKPRDMVTWTTLPLGVIASALSGEATLVSPALMRMVEVLDAEISIAITPRVR